MNEKMKNFSSRLIVWLARNAVLMLFVAFNCMSINAQNNQKVEGTVTSATDGNALIGVSVVVKGTSNGAITDLNGHYQLNVPAGTELEFSYIGFVTQSIKVKAGTQIYNISLAEDNETLEELVVVGYGVQKKSVVTAAMSKVSAEDLAVGTPTSVSDVLKGKMSGVQITSQSGQPGRDSQIRIRGTGTVNNSDPLYIIDGMPSNNGINYLNPSDIESIEVLKDAASAAIYGARGANGVILVTTKKGSFQQKTTVNYEFTYGIQNPARKIKLMNNKQYVMMMNEMAENSGRAPYFTDVPDVNTDWQDALTNSNAPIINHKLSVSGGGEHSAHYASFGYIKQEGIFAKGHSDYERYNGRLNYTNTLYDIKSRNFLNKVNFSTNLSYSRVNRKGNNIDNSETGGLIASINMLPPTESIYQDDPDKLAEYETLYPNYVKDANGRAYNIIELREINNPLASMAVNNNQRTVSQIFNADFKLDIDILPGLKYRTSASLEWAFSSIKNIVPAYDLNTTTKNSTSYVEDKKTDANSWQWENTLSYDKSFGEHTIGALFGTTMASYAYTDLSGSDYNLLVIDPDKAFIDIATGDRALERINGTGKDHKLASIFARLNYNYGEKYLFEAVVRRDGSSNFGPNNRYAIFPSVSAGWVISREKFMEGTAHWLSFLKLRASWGQNGNESIDPFGYTSMMNMSGNTAVINGGVVNGARPSGYVNSGLKWETSEQLDLGVDLRFFENALTFTFDYFNKKTKDMLMNVALPQYTGYATMRTNIGSVWNKGFEMEASYRFRIGKADIDLSANASYLKNKVIELGTARTNLQVLGGGLGGAVSVMESGMPYGYFWGYKTDGIFQNYAEVNAYKDAKGKLIMPDAEPGDVRYVDLNGDGTISDADRTMIGDPNPNWTYGFSVGINWNNFDMNAFFQGAAGNQIYKYYRRSNITQANWETEWLGRWHGEGTSNRLPKLVEGDPHHNTTWTNDLFVEDGNYLRLKVLQLGYSLPRNLTRKLCLQKLRVFVQGENLFTATKYSGYDPEVGTRNGFDGGTYPQARTFTFGANIVF